MIVPASSEEKVQFGVVSVFGVVTAVTSAITGAVVSVVVVVIAVAVDSSLSSLQEMTVRLKRRREKMMNRCFIWFPISGLGEPKLYHNLV